MATPTPASILKSVSQDAGYKRDLERAFAEGRKEGRSEARAEIIEWLQREYMKDGVSRAGERGAALLQVARDFTAWFKREGEPRKQEKKK